MKGTFMSKFFIPIVIIIGMNARFLLCQAPTLSVTDTGSGINQVIMVESSGQFKIGFTAKRNFGITCWYDLVNDPAATTNIINNCMGALFNQDVVMDGQHKINYYDILNTDAWEVPPDGGIRVLENTPEKVIIQSKGYPVYSSGGNLPIKSWTVASRYEMYPAGRIFMDIDWDFDSSVTTNELKTGWLGLTDPTYARHDSGSGSADGTPTALC